MKLSIFPTVNPLPKSKEEKHQQSKKASACEVRSVANEQDLFNLVTKYAWSPFIFDKNKRLADNFTETSFLVYDIDEGMTIDEAEAIVAREKLCCLCLPSTSHTPEAHRFRIILPLARTVTNAEVYEATWLKGAELFGCVDEQAKDLGRFYFGCRDDDWFWLEGEFFNPVLPEPTKNDSHTPSQTYMVEVTEDLQAVCEQIYGEKRNKIPEAVHHFVKNAHTGLKGTWTNDLSRFVFSLTLSGVDDTLIWDICDQLAPSKLDSKDKYQIKRAIRDGKAAV